MGNGRESQGRVKLQIDRLFDSHNHNESLIAHSIGFKCHLFQMILTFIFKVMLFRILRQYSMG